jgi:hypothetical protein
LDHDPHVAAYASLVCLAQALDLLGNALSIDLRQPAFTEEARNLGGHSKKSPSSRVLISSAAMVPA